MIESGFFPIDPGWEERSLPAKMNFLEDQLQGQLNLPRTGAHCGDPPRKALRSAKTIKNADAGISKVGSVEEIEELGSELQLRVLSQSRESSILHEGEV